MEREIATVSFRECLLAEAQPVSVLCSIMRIVWGLLHRTKLGFREARLSETGLLRRTLLDYSVSSERQRATAYSGRHCPNAFSKSARACLKGSAKFGHKPFVARL